jgi:hypothetical protein
MSRRAAFLVGSIIAILIGLFLIVLSFYYPLNSWQFPLLLGLGCALLPGGLFAVITDASFSDLLSNIIIRRVEDLADKQVKLVDTRVSDLVEKLDISLEVLSKSTSYLSQSKNLGIIMAYPDRRTALEHFLPYLRAYATNKSIPNRELVVVGSSVQGMIERYPDIGRQFSHVIEAGQEAGCDIRILLTHPAFSRYRETQESRQRYDIAKEILHAINWLEMHKLKNNQIKLYKGTPTTFMIATKERMLLNFYPYQTEAFNCFCLEVQDAGTDTCIYRSFYDNHFHKPWIGEQEERDHYIQTNSLNYIHKFLDGPVSDPSKILDDMKGPYGDFFVIDDEGTFYLAINIQKLKREVVYERSRDGGQKVIKIGDELDVKLLWLHEGIEGSWETVGHIEIDPDQRNGYWETTIRGHTFNSLSMLGLFDPKNNNVFTHVSSHPMLKGQPLPMLYRWLTQLSTSDEADGEDHQDTRNRT